MGVGDHLCSVSICLNDVPLPSNQRSRLVFNGSIRAGAAGQNGAYCQGGASVVRLTMLVDLQGLLLKVQVQQDLSVVLL